MKSVSDLYELLAMPSTKYNTILLLVENIGGTPVICGGMDSSNPPVVTSTCQGFNRHSQTWETYHDLRCPRVHAASVILPCDGSMMIAGGAETVETEVLVKHHGWKAGDPLPEIRNDGGCMLAINDCEVAFIGGDDSTGMPSNSIFIYNCKSKQWRTHDATLSKFDYILVY